MMNLQKTRCHLFLLAFIFPLFQVSAINATIVPQFIIMTENWEPYNFENDGEVKGISTDILVFMLERIGSAQGRNDIRIYPWIRAYKMIQQEPNTLLFTTTRTEEREKMFKWVGPIFEIELDIYALKSRNIKINSFEDIRKHKIGTLRGDVVEDLLIKKAGMKISDFQQVSSNIQNTKKLKVGRIDIVPQTKDTTIATSKEAGIDPDEFESVFILDKLNMYYAFHKGTPDSVIRMFQSAFDDLQKDGKVIEIFNKYGK